MRVMHSVTLVSDNGSYGGPVSVAIGQLSALRDRGHQVLLTALWSGATDPPVRLEDIDLRAARARTFVPRTGFLGLFSLRYGRILWQEVGSADMVHIHAGRDLASLAALGTAVARRKPFVVQTHGMIEVRTALPSRMVDRLLKPLISRATAGLVLTQLERMSLADALGARTPPLVILPNGVRLGHGDDHDRVAGCSVLFLARLHPRKRPTAFVHAAALVTRAVPEAKFDIYGPDEGSLAEVRSEIARLGLDHVVTYHGAVDHAEAQRITGAADVYILPSIDEPFPMSLLEALAVGTPVICTESTGISEELGRRGAAVVTDGSPEELAEATVGILTDSDRREQLVSAGDRAVSEAFSIDAVAVALERIYAGATAGPR